MSVLPGLLLHELVEVKGFDEQAFITAHQQPAPTSVRLHPLKRNSAFDQNEEVLWCAAGRYLSERPVFTLDPSYHTGTYYVQEASSMFLDNLLWQLLPDTKGLRVLDLCAAPGGKSTLIASLLEPSALLISNEVIRTRASILEENMTRWGYMNTWVTSNDPSDFGRLPGYFDLMVVDAPCSGSGLFRKDERAIDEWSQGNVALCSQRQQRILADAWPALKEDGVLIYATCSYSPEEDEHILEWLQNEFNVAALHVPVPEAWGVVEVEAGALKGYRFFPHCVKGEGLFIAAIRKKEATETLKPQKYKKLHEKKIQQKATGLVNEGEDLIYVQTGKDIYNVLPAAHEEDLQLLQKTLYLRKAGLHIGMPAAKEWLPAHEVALSVDIAKDIKSVEVNKEQALHYLKKEEMTMPLPGKGWYVVKYEGYGLGWIKSLGNRVNNYLPKHWRIRMDITEADWA